jgi:two-component system, sensor histidine kinase and response regulator
MQRHLRILIVDDHPSNVAIMEEILGDHYALKTASCGEEALAIAPDFHPALILLDIMMPGIGGYETCRRIRAHPTLRHTKIIMVSARAMVSERLQGYEAGADDYLTKPFDEEELVAKVRVYLRLKSLDEVEQLTPDARTLLAASTPIVIREPSLDTPGMVPYAASAQCMEHCLFRGNNDGECSQGRDCWC